MAKFPQHLKSAGVDVEGARAAYIKQRAALDERLVEGNGGKPLTKDERAKHSVSAEKIGRIARDAVTADASAALAAAAVSELAEFIQSAEG